MSQMSSAVFRVPSDGREIQLVPVSPAPGGPHRFSVFRSGCARGESAVHQVPSPTSDRKATRIADSFKRSSLRHDGRRRRSVNASERRVVPLRSCCKVTYALMYSSLLCVSMHDAREYCEDAGAGVPASVGRYGDRSDGLSGGRNAAPVPDAQGDHPGRDRNPVAPGRLSRDSPIREICRILQPISRRGY